MNANIKLNEYIKAHENNVAIIIGLYVNGYHIVKSLANNNIPLVAIDFQKKCGIYSKYINQKIIIDYSQDELKLLELLLDIGKQLNKKGVLFPTHDHHTKLFSKYYTKLEKYFFIPVNPDTLPLVLSKEYQYNICNEIGIPYPKSYFLRTTEDVDNLMKEVDSLMYPVIIKPFSRANNSALGNIFRVKEINSKHELITFSKLLYDNISTGFLVSEVVPGEPDNIWAYTGYCDKNSNIVAGWTGRKLTQYPYYFGVFSTAKYEKNLIVEEQGKRLLKAFKHIGIGEPEFKYDYRDNKYKLMETNPRYMMWHGVGKIGGVNLPLIHYYHITKQFDKFNRINKIQENNTAHLVFMFHEISNIFKEKPKQKYIKNAIKAIFLPNKEWAIFDIKDLGPFIHFGGITKEVLKYFYNKIRK